MKDILLLKQGELILKGLNKRRFEQKLIGNIKRRLRSLGPFRVYSAQSAIYVEPEDEGINMDKALEAMQKVFGIVSVSRAYSCPKDPDAVFEAAHDYLREQLLAAHSFKVESRRSDKRFPMTSIALSQYVGGKLHNAYPHLRVDVHNPELTVNVEIREYSAYVHAGGLPGAGGLPVGTGGRAVSLLSGGIDSPVATWMAAKRGIAVIPVHFFSFPYTSEQAKQKVLDLASILSPYCGKMAVEIVPFTRIQEEIRKHCPEKYFTLLMRRFMMRISEKIAERNGCKALITGENLGQVASQTMEALAVTEECISLPVLRPLICFDKGEIVSIARKIGTYETSILPYEDCCTVFTPRHPKTKPRIEDVRQAEIPLDVSLLVDEAVENTERVDVPVWPL
ncbi:MAG: tRNA 4-thiouridine(8) synthase ThiI [Clostridiales bacterium]|nr:tRNA 4-thiouridine(8) synthase ThiI [Clostridiales bacterium]